MTYYLLLALVSLAVAGFAFFRGRPDVAWGFLWGIVLGELNLRLLWRRLVPAGSGETREAAGKRLFIAFLVRYAVIIAGVWFGAAVFGGNVPAILIGLVLAYTLGVLRVARKR